jgi:branched-chain amino acid transport system substrate-binding protein
MRAIARGRVGVPFMLAVLLTACAGGSGSPQEQLTAAGPIPIGVAVATTSDVGLLGQLEVNGALVAERVINAQGGVNGRPIEVIVEDTGGDEAGARTAFENLIQSTPVVGIVGPTLSQQAFAADPIADQYGVPVLAPSNTAAGIPQIGEYIARVSAPVSVVAPNSINEALRQDPAITRVAVAFAQNDAFASSETQTFQNTIRERQLELVTVQTFNTTDTDFSSTVDGIMAADPQLVVVSGLAVDSGTLVRQLRDAGYAGSLVGGNGFNSEAILPVCGIGCEGALIAQAYSPDTANEINRAFADAYLQDQGRPPPQLAAQAFTGVQVFVEALRALDSTQGLAELDLSDLRRELNTQVLAGTYTTPLGNISFTPEGEINQEQFYVARIDMNDDGRTGRFVFVQQ